ncbi:Tyrosine recombinase XerD [compost metagenome]
MPSSTSPTFAGLVQEFFTDYMLQQRALSPCTVASYRDAFLLMLRFAEQHLGKPSSALQLADIDAKFLASFLEHLERDRHNTVRSRNIRLAAIRSFLRFAARRDVSNLRVIEQALAVPTKRSDRPMIGFLSKEQMLAVMDISTVSWLGHRDRLMVTLLYNTGARVSEIVGVRVGDVILGPTSFIHLHGKGRKQRSLPLWKSAARDIRDWLGRNPQLTEQSPLLPTRQGTAMNRATVCQRLKLATKAASDRHPELANVKVSPHRIRHSTAMAMLQSGIWPTEIALWLGHESPTTTHMYVEADLEMKKRALARLNPPDVKRARYQPPQTLLRFLKSL